MGNRTSVVVALAAAQGAMSGDNWLPARPVTGLLLLGMLAYGVIAVPVVVWAQRLNPRNKPAWHFPSWRRNPLTMRDPLQFFHMVGFVFTAAGWVSPAAICGSGNRCAWHMRCCRSSASG